MAVLAIVLTVAAFCWLQSLLYRKRWHHHVSLDLSFSEKYATEGDTLFLTEVITNRKLLPLPWLSVKFQVSRHLLFSDRENAKISDDYYRNDLFNLLMFQRITRRLPFVCGKRGFYTIKSAELISGDILAREKLTMPVPFNATLTVYPRTVALEEVLTVHRQFLGQILTKRYIQPDPFEFKGIREYQPFDSLRTVNFKATAKTGELMVNVQDYTVTQEIVLVMNLQPYSAYPNETLYEETLRLAASLAAYYVSNAIPISFISNARGTETVVSDAPDTLLQLEGGSGSGHLDTINDALAHIDLRKKISLPGRAMLETVARRQETLRRAGHEPAYIILSTFHEKEFAEAYASLCETGADALWIIPVLTDMDVAVPLSERVVKAVMSA